jgi:hypothetical protein
VRPATTSQISNCFRYRRRDDVVTLVAFSARSLSPAGNRPACERPEARSSFQSPRGSAIVGALEPQNGETTTLTEDEVAAANATTILNAQRQIYAKTGDLRYRVDPAQPPRAASDLVTDERFLR